MVEVRPHYRPVPFSVKTFTLPTLFAGQKAACLFRPYQNRIKGRDWYDFLWYVSRGSRFSLSHFVARASQIEGVSSIHSLDLESVKLLFCRRLDALSLDAMKADVRPFVRDPQVVDSWTKEIFHAAVERLEAV